VIQHRLHPEVLGFALQRMTVFLGCLHPCYVQAYGLGGVWSINTYNLRSAYQSIEPICRDTAREHPKPLVQTCPWVPTTASSNHLGRDAPRLTWQRLPPQRLMHRSPRLGDMHHSGTAALGLYAHARRTHRHATQRNLIVQPEAQGMLRRAILMARHA